jgi:hypothetical protein
MYLHGRVDDKGSVEEHESDDLNCIPLSNRHERQGNLEHAEEISLKSETLGNVRSENVDDEVSEDGEGWRVL